MRLFMIQRRVNDWPNAVAWYRDILGLKSLILDEPGRFALLNAGRAKLALKERDEDDSAAASDTSLVFQVDDLDAERERLSRLGVSIGSIRENQAEHFRECHLADPEGNAITLFTWMN
jgi:predicted enzyme related to lactoylglutathione lyase